MYLKYDGSVALESASNNGVNIWATGSGQTIRGGALNDVLGGAGGDTLIGGLGDNQYYLSGLGNSIVQGATGVNTVTTWMSYTLPDNIQNLNVAGDYLYAAGNSLDNLIKVGDTNAMSLWGAGGNNVLVGGRGSDTFVIDNTAGSNAIYGWHAGDAIRLMGGNFTTFAQVHAAMTQQGSDVVLKNGDNNLVIRNTTVSQFQASDFYVALDHSKLGAATFDDEFNSLSLRSASNPHGTWTPMYGDGSAYSALSLGSHTLVGNAELQIYTDPTFTGPGSTNLGLNPFSISNGVLDIRAQKVDAATSANMWGYGYTSGLITTHESFSQLYGYFEMKAELPQGVSGAWPAFWLLPADGSWPPELDVMETLSGTGNIDYTTAHSQASGSHTAVGSPNLVTDASGYHTYGVLWTADTITWFLDGQEVFQTATPADMHKPMYMLANMAVGGWAGAPDFTSADMKVDYIRAYGLADGSSATHTSVGLDAPSTDTTPPASSGSGAPTGGSSSTGGSSASGSGSSSGDGSSSTSGAGLVFTSDNSGDHWTGTSANETFYLGRGGDVVASGGGTDTFVFKEVPWAAGHISGFAGADVLDLAFLKAYGYTGSDPVADGHVKLIADGAGGTQVWAVLDGLPSASGTWLVTTLDGITPANVAWQDGHLTDPPASSSGSSSGGVAAPAQTITDTIYVAPSGVTSITLAGSTQTVTGNDAGDTFLVSNNSLNHIIGGSGNDTFVLGRGGDVVTGGGGADKFVFNETPWAAGHITDFDPAHDTIDVSGLLARSGYSGSNPIGDGFIKLVDGAGGVQVWSNLDHIAQAGWWLVTTLDGVSASKLSMQGDTVTGAQAAAVVTPGVTLVSDNDGNHLAGGAGNDTFYLGRGGDVATGGGGADTFVFNETPWAGAHITDFTPGQDVLDLSPLLTHEGYTGSDPVADGYIKVQDAAGGAQVWSNLDPVSPGAGWWLVTTLDNVSASSLHIHGDFIGG